jgi:hypothetical protein
MLNIFCKQKIGISKNGYSLLEGDAVLQGIRLSLVIVPFKSRL